MGAFPSGQWGQTVNLLLNASVVRIHQLPPKRTRNLGCGFFFVLELVGFEQVGRPQTAKNSPADCSACQKISTLLYRECRGDHWSPASLAQQRAFRDGFLTRHTGMGEQCSPLQEFFDSLNSPADCFLERGLRIHQLPPKSCGKNIAAAFFFGVPRKVGKGDDRFSKCVL